MLNTTDQKQSTCTNKSSRDNRGKENITKVSQRKLGVSKVAVQASTLEFSRDRKMMSVLAQGPNNQDVIFVKGAPESVLDKCSHVSPALPCSAHVKML